MEIQESGEMYLETILVLQDKKSAVRSIDVANELNYTKASISRAMKKLREEGHISIDDAGHITLAESGRKIAETMYERHTVLSEFLTKMGVDAKIAAEDACRIEHVISQQSFEKIRDSLNNK